MLRNVIAVRVRVSSQLSNFCIAQRCALDVLLSVSWPLRHRRRLRYGTLRWKRANTHNPVNRERDRVEEYDDNGPDNALGVGKRFAVDDLDDVVDHQSERKKTGRNQQRERRAQQAAYAVQHHVRISFICGGVRNEVHYPLHIEVNPRAEQDKRDK